jgi:photosystem II stability/assembly factor-like uncharacterized protein
MRRLTIFIFIALAASIRISAQTEYQIVYDIPLSRDFHDIVFLDSIHGYVVGQKGLILRTENGGNSWDSVNSGTSETLNSISFLNASTLYACGSNGCIIKSRDAGKSWEIQKTGIADYLNIVVPLSRDTVIVFGQNGKMYRTVNSGKTWVLEKPITKPIAKQNITSVRFFESKTLLALYSGWDSSTVYRSNDRGTSWKLVSTAKSRIDAFSFPDTLRGFGIEHFNNICSSVNGGRTWDKILDLRKGEVKTELSSIFFINANVGYVTGNYGGNAIVLYTIDGGRNWNDLLNIPNVYIARMYISTVGDIFMIGASKKRNIILKVNRR